MVGGKDLLIIIPGHYGNCSPAGCVSGFLKPQNNQRTLKEYVSRPERGRDDKSIARVQVCLAWGMRTGCPSAGAEAPAPVRGSRPGPAADTPRAGAGCGHPGAGGESRGRQGRAEPPGRVREPGAARTGSRSFQRTALRPRSPHSTNQHCK